MPALPIDVSLALAVAGIDIYLPEAELESAIRSAIADRRGYLGEIEIADIGYRVELLFPVRMSFEGRTPEMALAWVLISLMGECCEFGAASFAS